MAIENLPQLLAGLADATPVGISVLDLELRFVYVNDAMAGLHGVDRPEHLSRPLHEVLPGVSDTIASALDLALLGESTNDLEVAGPSPFEPGAEGHWQMSIFPVLSLEGAVTGVGLIARDVTAAVRLVEARSLALQRQAELLGQAREISLTLQRALLPSPSQHAGFEWVARYLPGTAHLEVGGDWYDVVPLPAGTFGIVIGDVMGKGVLAAALMGQLRAGLRAYTRLGMAPAALLELLDGLVQELDESVIVTCLFGILDVEAGTFTYATAGHLPPVVLGPDGAVVVSGPTGPPLGSGGGHSEHVLTLPAGFTLGVCTDGLVEDRGRAIDEGLALFAEAVADGPPDLEALADHVLAAMDRADGYDDDVALLMLRVTAPAR